MKNIIFLIAIFFTASTFASCTKWDLQPGSPSEPYPDETADDEVVTIGAYKWLEEMGYTGYTYSRVSGSKMTLNVFNPTVGTYVSVEVHFSDMTNGNKVREAMQKAYDEQIEKYGKIVYNIYFQCETVWDNVNDKNIISASQYLGYY